MAGNSASVSGCGCALRAAHSQPWRLNSACREHGKLQAYQGLKRMTRDFGANRLDPACGRAVRLGATCVPVATFEVAGRRGRFAAAVDIAAWLWRQRGGNAHLATSAGVIDQIEAPDGAP